MPDTAGTSANNTRTVHYETRRRACFSQPSDTLPGTDPPDDTLIQRCGRPHEQGLDIRVLCPPHAHPSHGNARHSQVPSGISASLLDSSDGHEHPAPPSVSGSDWCVPPASTHIYPQTTVVRVTQGRTATVSVAVIPPYSLDAENAFSEGNEDPPIHHGQGAQRPQHKCKTKKPLLT